MTRDELVEAERWRDVTVSRPWDQRFCNPAADIQSVLSAARHAGHPGYRPGACRLFMNRATVHRTFWWQRGGLLVPPSHLIHGSAPISDCFVNDWLSAFDCPPVAVDESLPDGVARVIPDRPRGDHDYITLRVFALDPHPW